MEVTYEVLASLNGWNSGYWRTNQKSYWYCRLCCTRRQQSGVITLVCSARLRSGSPTWQQLHCEADTLSWVTSTVQVHHPQVSESQCADSFSATVLLLTCSGFILWKTPQIPHYGNFITTENSLKRFHVDGKIRRLWVCLCVNAQVLMQLEFVHFALCWRWKWLVFNEASRHT